MTATITNQAEFQSFVDDIGADFERLTFVPLMREELSNLAVAHDWYFQTQTGPDGVSWNPNADSTIFAKKHDRILRGHPKNQQRLQKSLTRKSPSADAVREVIEVGSVTYANFGTDVEYSAFNDFGTNRTPARPHIGVPESYVDRFAERAADYALEKMARAT